MSFRLILVLFFLQTSLYSNLDPNVSLSQYANKKWDIVNGLNDSWVREITRKNGSPYVWIATSRGIERFDGKEFVAYDRNTSPYINGGVSCIEVINDNKIWVGTNHSGLLLFENNEFIPIEDPLLKDIRSIESLKYDSRGWLWIAGEDRFLLLRDDELSIVPNWGDAEKNVLYIEEDANGVMWIGTTTSLIGLDTDNFTKKINQACPPVFSIRPTTSGKVWIGTRQGLFYLDDNTFSQVQFEQPNLLSVDSNERVFSLTEDHQGNVFVGTLKGIYKVTDECPTPIPQQCSFRSNIISSLYFDEEENLWVGTRYAGIGQMWRNELTVFSQKDGLSNPVINVTYEDNEHILWVGTDKGLNVITDGKVSSIHSKQLGSLRIRDVLKDSKRVLWVATYSGLFRFYEGNSDNFDVVEDLPTQSIRQLLEDQNGRIWIGTRNGLVMLDGSERSIWRTPDLKNELILHVYEDRKGNIWIATDGGGIARYETDGSFTCYDKNKGLREGIVFKIHEDNDRDGFFWLSTSNGLVLFDGNSFTTIGRQEGLPFETVFQLLESDGEFWITTREGPIIVHKKEIWDCIEGKIEKIHPVIYGEQDGLITNKMTSVAETCILDDGTITFASRNGVAFFKEQKNKPCPRYQGTYFERMVVNDNVIDRIQDDSAILTIDPGVKTLEIYYGAKSLVSTDAIYFRTRLHGFQEKPKETQERHVSFTNLPPGIYRFEIQSRNSTNDWDKEVKSLSFRIRPNIYQQVWFYPLTLLGAVLLTILLYRARILHMRIQQSRLEEKVRARTEETSKQKTVIEAKVIAHEKTLRHLQFTNEELKRVNSEKNQLLGIAAHDMKNPLSAINYLSQEILKERDKEQVQGNGENCYKYVEIIARASSELFQLVTQLTDSISLETGNIQLKKDNEDVVHIANSVLDMNLQSSQKKSIEITCDFPKRLHASVDELRIRTAMDNYISNAIKYTPANGNISVKIAPTIIEHQNCFRFEVSDSGPGLKDEDFPNAFKRFTRLSAAPTGNESSTGLGLSIVKQVVTLHHGYVDVKNNAETGATFSFTIPCNSSSNNGIDAEPPPPFH